MHGLFLLCLFIAIVCLLVAISFEDEIPQRFLGTMSRGQLQVP